MRASSGLGKNDSPDHQLLTIPLLIPSLIPPLIPKLCHPVGAVMGGGYGRDGTGALRRQETRSGARGRDVEQPSHLSADDMAGHDERRADHLGQSGCFLLQVERHPTDAALGTGVEVHAILAQREHRRGACMLRRRR